MSKKTVQETNEESIREKKWTIYGVSDANKTKVRVFAAQNNLSIGRALNLLVEEWERLKQEKEKSTKRK
jgi:hypothetical protein